LSEERSIELKQGATEKLTKIDLKRAEVAPPAPPTTSFSVSNGTPGVEILVDSQPVGTTGANGGWSRKINPGSHTITLRKTGYEEKEIKMKFDPGQVVGLSAVEATLSLLGSLTFEVKPDDAQISYTRDGEGQSHSAKNGTVPVKQGRYKVEVTAPGRLERTVSVNVAPGKNERIDLMLNLVPATEVACVFDAAQWTKDDEGWEVHKGSTYAGLCRNKGNIALQIKPLGKFRKRAEWTFEYSGEGRRIQYTLEQKSIERKVFVDNKEEKSQSAKKDISQLSADSPWPVELRIEADRVTIASGAKVLDLFELPDGSATPNRVAFKGDVGLKMVGH
jgi:hypothetical protein